MVEYNDGLFQEDWLAAMCAHYQQSLLDGDTDNASGLRILLDQLNISPEILAGIEAFAAAQRPPDPVPIDDSAYVDSAASASDDSSPDVSEPVMVFDQQATVDPPTEIDPVMESMQQVTPDVVAFVTAVLPIDQPDSDSIAAPVPESISNEPDPLISTRAAKAAKSVKKPKPDKSQPSLF